MKCLDKDSIYYTYIEVLRLHHCRAHELLEEIDLYPGQPALLHVLNMHSGKSQKELAEIMTIKPSTINVMIKRMEKLGMVERRQDSIDARVSRIYITSKGQQMHEKAMLIMQEIEKEMFEHFTPEEIMLCRRLFLQMKSNLQQREKD